MAKSNQPNFTHDMLQQGFQQIDSSIAADDPEMGAIIDDLISKLAGPMAKRMGINAQSLKQLTMNVIRQRARQLMAEEGDARSSKMRTVQQLGQAERGADLQAAGLKLQKDAFDNQIAMRYVGAALSAAGSFIGQGIASGMFTADPAINPDVDHEGYDDFDAQDLDINPHTGRPLTENELTEGPIQESSAEAAQQQSIEDYFKRSAAQRKLQDEQAVIADEAAQENTMKGMNPRGVNPYNRSMDVRSSPAFDTEVPLSTPLQELGSLAPQEPSGMRNKTDKDRFAGILNALRGGFNA